MKKWQIESVPSIGGNTPQKLVFTGHDSFPKSANLLNSPKKEPVLVIWIRYLVGRLIHHL